MRTAYYDAVAKMLTAKPFKKEAAMDNARDATSIYGGCGLMH